MTRQLIPFVLILASNYDPNATDDDNSCIIYGCAIDAWFICPGSYNPNATVNDWAFCDFTFDGCDNTAGMPFIPSPEEYPVLRLTEITDDIIDAYYYLGLDKVGCMDRKASNYLHSAIVDDESCMYSLESENIISDHLIEIYPQPAKMYVILDFTEIGDFDNKPYTIHNILGEELYSGIVKYEKIKINTHTWISGVYYLNIEAENTNITHRFAIE